MALININIDKFEADAIKDLKEQIIPALSQEITTKIIPALRVAAMEISDGVEVTFTVKVNINRKKPTNDSDPTPRP